MAFLKRKSELEEDCSLVNTAPTRRLSGRQVVVQREGFGWRGFAKISGLFSEAVCLGKHPWVEPSLSPFFLVPAFPLSQPSPAGGLQRALVWLCGFSNSVCTCTLRLGSDGGFERTAVSSPFVTGGFLLRLKSQGGAVGEKK